MSVSVSLHGPMTAEAVMLYSATGRCFGVVRLKGADGLDVALHTKNAEGAQAIADAINAAFANAEKKEAA